MTTLKLTTADDLFTMADDGYRYELVRGELIRMAPAGARHGELAQLLGWHLTGYVRAQRLGKTYAAETGFMLARDPDTVRAPDVSFVRADRLPQGPSPDGYLDFAPDLAVEVVSPSDRLRAVTQKAMDYLDAGVRAVWLIHPGHRTVTIYYSDRVAHTLSEADTLDGGDVVPGFRLPVAQIFSE